MIGSNSGLFLVVRPEVKNMNIVVELWQFLKERKKWWLLPVILGLLFLGFLIVMTSGSALGPFIYTLF